jgi:hypothetical protein
MQQLSDFIADSAADAAVAISPSPSNSEISSIANCEYWQQ